MPGVGLGIPVIGTLGLLAAAEAAVQHHHQRHRIGQALGSVQVKGPADAPRLDALGGLPDRDRLRARRSQRSPATQAATEGDSQDGDEARAGGPGATRLHGDIVAADAEFDKSLVNLGVGGTLSPCDALSIPTGSPPSRRW
ncbi:hypothetical protein MPRS_38890 [Mycobacterium paraseoulense]|nr:hypothetical protein MPRS_38890 [Mycobacterium paraseoulense]